MTGIGIDILELSRVHAIAYLDRAAEYILVPKEIEEFNQHRDKAEFFTSRFAAKEAVIKAFPTRISPLDFTISKIGVKPTVVFLKPEHARYRALVSISHSLEYVAGFAVVFGPKPLSSRV